MSAVINIGNGSFTNIDGDYISHEITTNINIEEPLEKFKKWLNVPDPSTNHNNARSKHHDGSGQWLLEDERYIKWKQEPNSFMWINGISGCGKTLICSTIIEDIATLAQVQPGTGLAYFYFDVNDKAKQSLRSLLSYLVLSLTAKSKNYHIMDKLYVKHDKLNLPTDNELLSLIMELLQGFGQAYIVIDALDECNNDYHELFAKVIKVICGWKLEHFHLLVSSRREEGIIVNITEMDLTEICVSEDLVGSDIESYIHSAVVNDYKFRRWDSSVQDDIKNRLISGANGMFRWVACQIEELGHCRSQKVLMETLKGLPRDLEGIYDQILHRIDEKDASAAKIILQWLVLGMAPLAVEELAIVITFDQSSGHFDSSLELADPDDVIYMCSSLITKTAANNTVQLAHASVKEYFLQKPRMIALVDVKLGHTAIVQCCLKYFLQHGEGNEDDCKLLPYAGEWWPSHYKLSNRNTSVQDLATKVLWDLHGSVTKWHLDAHLLPRFYDQISPLHYVALFGLEEIIQKAITTNEWNWTYNDLTQIAAQFGYIGIIRQLLDSGADVNAQGGKYGNALLAASHNGHIDIVRQLLDEGANVNVQGGEYGSALLAASDNGHTDIVRQLLDKGAAVNAQGGYYGNALQAASHNGHTDIVRQLLDKGADVNAQGGRYGNALQAASHNGHANIMRQLLDKGADVNAQGGRFCNALQAALDNGHTDIVRQLLDEGADVNAKGGEYGSALLAASDNGHTDIVKQLLGKGADVNGQGGYYGNALQAASHNGHTDIVRQLLEKGADVNVQGGYYSNALQAASHNGHADIVKQLLDKGADVNAQGGRFFNALQAALDNGHTDIVRQLLDEGADVNAQGGEYGSALLTASDNGHTDIVRELLDNGADVNAQGGYYGNALQAASDNGHTDIVRQLLDKGANVNAQGGYYGNALQAASHNGHANIVRELLDKGADVNTQGGYYGNALQAASLNGHADIVRELLDSGADVNAQGGRYGNALQAALDNGHANIVRELLDNGANVASDYDHSKISHVNMNAEENSSEFAALDTSRSEMAGTGVDVTEQIIEKPNQLSRNSSYHSKGAQAKNIQGNHKGWHMVWHSIRSCVDKGLFCD